MQIARIALTVVLSSLVAGTALAQGTPSTPRIDARQERQAERIDKGVESGQLNKREAARMEKGQARVQKMEDRAAADGKMTKGERRRIEHAQDTQSARIAKQKHDAQKAHKGEAKGQ